MKWVTINRIDGGTEFVNLDYFSWIEFEVVGAQAKSFVEVTFSGEIDNVYTRYISLEKSLSMKTMLKFRSNVYAI